MDLDLSDRPAFHLDHGFGDRQPPGILRSDVQHRTEAAGCRVRFDLHVPAPSFR